MTDKILTNSGDVLTIGGCPVKSDLATSTPAAGYKFVFKKKAGQYTMVDGKRVVLEVPINAPYGTIWDQAADTYQHGYILGGQFVEATVTAFPIHENLKRCLLLDNGTVNYYLDPTDSTLKADGNPADLTGTDGQVTVEVPLFHHIRHFYGDKRAYFVGDVPFDWYLSGTKISSSRHDFFTKAGVNVDYRYIGAYEGSYSAGKLSSVSGVSPQVSQNRAQFRAAATARGTAWHQYDVAAHDALAVLYITEYADWDTQTKIGIGLTQYVAWPGSAPAQTGNSNSIGDATGDSSWAVPRWAATTAKTAGFEVIPVTSNNYTYRAQGGGTTGAAEPTWPTTIGNTVVDNDITWECVRSAQYMSYRGVENWYGHIWKFQDGANVHNSTALRSQLWLCFNHLHYADDISTNYSLAGQLPEANGWAGDALDAAGVFPADLAGDSAVRLCDYYYTYFGTDPDVGWRVGLLGGGAYNGSPAGAFYVASHGGSTLSGSSLGGRLCF